MDSTNCRDIDMIPHNIRLHAVQKFMLPKVLIEDVLEDEFVVVDEFWIGSEIELEEQHVNHPLPISTIYLEQCPRWHHMHQFVNTFFKTRNSILRRCCRLLFTSPIAVLPENA